MRRLFTRFAFFLTATSLWPLRAGLPPDDARELSGPDRILLVRVNRESAVKQRFEKAGLAYPPREIFLRAFKREAVVELWAREATPEFRLVATYAVLAASGEPGPKRREGDRQVPEGFYEIDRFNPESRYHLSLGLNYPNAADRVLSDSAEPGFDIFIHGKAVSMGCLALGDAQIEELYLAALDARSRGQAHIPVHLFPARMRGADWETFAREQTARDPALARFWEQLQAGYEAFERSHRVPEITVTAEGAYRVDPRSQD